MSSKVSKKVKRAITDNRSFVIVNMNSESNFKVEFML